MQTRVSILGRGTALGLLALAMIAPVSRSDDSDALMARFDTMVRYNLDNPAVVPSATIDSLAAAWQSQPLGDRVAAWARWFLHRGDVGYLFGRDPGGYVTDGRIAQDFSTDCVLFMYRTTELARSNSAVEAIQFAFGTRFYGAAIKDAIAEDGKVNYDVPAHLEFAEDMVKSDIWGENVSGQVGSSVFDAVGSSRAEPDTVRYVPTREIDYGALRSGDIVWFVGDDGSEEAAAQRRVGTMIHHIGIIDRSGGEVLLVHPALRPLPGVYENTGVVEVPLRVYLSRVGKFKGIIVTRLKDF